MPSHPGSTAARRLADAFRSQDWIESLADGEHPATLREAYDRQGLLQDELGYQPFGWKVAGASARGLRNSPTGTATFGRLWQECRHPSGVHLPLPKSGAITLEVEIAVRFARDVEPAREPFDGSMIDGSFVAIEIVRSRFIDRKAVGHLSFVADDAGFHAFILGAQMSDSLESAPLSSPASLLRDDAVLAGALQGDDRTDVLVSLAQFWAHAAEMGAAIPAGAIVTTGTQTAPVDTASPGAYEGRIAGFAVRFSLG